MTKANKVSIPAYTEELRVGRSVVRDIAQAVRTGNIELFLQSMERLYNHPSFFSTAMRAIAKSPCRSTDFRATALSVWIHYGETWRLEVDNDLVLADALRVILPPYTGPAITLYRGESARNRKRRTYGLSWTAREEIGRDFANRLCRTSEGGSVLLETIAPAGAIICAPGLIENRYAEHEYVVDRRRLATIRVLKRYSHSVTSNSRSTSRGPQRR
jgi:hypothetical protein